MRTVDYITPKCCDKVKESKAVRLGFYPESTPFGEWKDIKPTWYIAGDIILMDTHYNTKVEVMHCPFCQTVLPDVVKSQKKKIAEGDEGYCDTCKERHMCCNCYPPEYRWKIKE